MKTRTRYAPSPTGYLHIGGARTALFCYLYAKHMKGDFIVRIEDTDTARNVEGGVESQLDNLRWMGIDIDETVDKPGKFGPYKQTERLDTYQKHIKILLDKGLAYECYCSQEELQASREKQREEGIYSPRYDRACLNRSKEEIEELKKKGIKPTIRIKVPEEETFAWDDIVRGNIEIVGKDVGDWVICKANGIPTYNFAVVIDDHLMEISDVFRGEEHISNTAKQLHLYKAFGWKAPNFGHLTIITNKEGKKLSKRDTSLKQFIEDYKNSGYSPDAMFNFLAFLGWSPEGTNEIYSKEELIKIFDIKRLSKSPSFYDEEKMRWMSSQYFSKMSVDEAFEFCKPFLEKEKVIEKKGEEWSKKLVEIYKGGLSCGEEIVQYALPFFEKFEIESEAKKFLRTNDTINTVKVFKRKFTECNNITAEEFKRILDETKGETGAKGKLLFMPIRIITTGKMHGPDLYNTIALIGIDEVKKRLK